VKRGWIVLLKKRGLLPESALRCRYCEGAIEVDAKQCPHCHLWLVADFPLFDLDPCSTIMMNERRRKWT
jgi:hypothetical protein